MKKPSREVIVVVVVTLLELSRAHLPQPTGTRLTVAALVSLVFILETLNKSKSFVQDCVKAASIGGSLFLVLYIHQTHQWHPLFS